MAEVGLNSAAALGAELDDSANVLRWTSNTFELPDATITLPVNPRLIARPDKATHLTKRVFKLPQVCCMRIGYLERVSRQTAETLGVEVEWGTKAIGFDDQSRGTQVLARDSGGTPRKFDAWLAVIADGGGDLHKRAVLRLSQPHLSGATRLLETIGVDVVPDSPFVSQFMLGYFRTPDNSRPKMSIRATRWKGTDSVRTQRFDLPGSASMVQIALPTSEGPTEDDKLAWLAWAAHEHGIADSTLISPAVEYSTVATRTKQIVIRNPSAADGLSGAKILAGRARAATSQLNGVGLQMTGWSDAMALARLLESLLLPASEASGRAPLKAYAVGRHNVGRAVARLHHPERLRIGVREFPLEEFEYLIGEARKRGYDGSLPPTLDD